MDSTNNINIHYEFFKMYLFYSKELYTKNMFYNEKYIKLILHIYNNLHKNIPSSPPNPEKIFNYYYIEKKNNFKKIADKCSNIRNEILFLHNYYNYYIKHTNTYYKVNLDIIKKHYTKFYNNKLTKDNFYTISEAVFKHSHKGIKKPKISKDIEINNRNLNNICKYFNLIKF